MTTEFIQNTSHRYMERDIKVSSLWQANDDDEGFKYTANDDEEGFKYSISK